MSDGFNNLENDVLLSMVIEDDEPVNGSLTFSVPGIISICDCCSKSSNFTKGIIQ